MFCCKYIVLEKWGLIFLVLMNVGHFGRFFVKGRGLLLVHRLSVSDGGNNIVEIGRSKNNTLNLSKGDF